MVVNLKASRVYPVRLMINFSCEPDGSYNRVGRGGAFTPSTQEEETDGSLSSGPV